MIGFNFLGQFRRRTFLPQQRPVLANVAGYARDRQQQHPERDKKCNYQPAHEAKREHLNYGCRLALRRQSRTNRETAVGKNTRRPFQWGAAPALRRGRKPQRRTASKDPATLNQHLFANGRVFPATHGFSSPDLLNETVPVYLPDKSASR